MPAITAKERKWMEEDDARTLADAEVIRGDSARYKRAIKAAKRLSDEETKRADWLRKVAGLKPLKK